MQQEQCPRLAGQRPVNRYSYDATDIPVAAEVVLDTVMNARANRIAALPFWKRVILASAR